MMTMPKNNLPVMDNDTLAKRLRLMKPDWSWQKCRDFIKSGRVLIDNKVIDDPSFRVHENTAIVLQERRTKAEATPDIHVYHCDKHVIVAEKPSGIDSVPFHSKHSEQSSLLKSKKAANSFIDLCRKWIEVKEGRKFPPLRIVQRLDKGTSGIIVFARTIEAEKHLGLQFKKHSISRLYLAVVYGKPTTGTIRSTFVTDRGDGYRGSRTKAAMGSNEKEAITHVKVLRTEGDYSLVECRLETGRTHQIRIHLSEAGHPLCGDLVYRKPSPKSHKAIVDKSQATRIMLHAKTLGFLHPKTGQKLEFESQSFLMLANDFIRRLSR
jgi:23S rRNA pseudouridine1911/1915/1917 synthase